MAFKNTVAQFSLVNGMHHPDSGSSGNDSISDDGGFRCESLQVITILQLTGYPVDLSMSRNTAPAAPAANTGPGYW